MAPAATSLLSAFIAFHVAALALAWGTRLAIGSKAESVVQTTFLVALAIVGFVAWSSHRIEPGLGIPSGATLVAMVLVAVGDFRRTHDPAHGTHGHQGR